VRVVDEFTTATNIANGQANPTAYVSAQGNVPRARARGLEFDGNYAATQNLNLRFSGAYNDARYISFPLAAKPDELGYLTAPYVDQSGLRLPGAAKWTGNIGAEYRLPLRNSYQLHASFNTALTSRYNNSDTLSEYGWVPGGGITDLSFGLTTKNNVDISVVVKNATDNRKHEPAWVSYAPNPYPRWVGLTVSGKL
jgi:iron complex outermembrane receptor protein